MKLSVYNNIRDGLSNRLAILKAAVVYTFQEDTAYAAENWAAVISTVIYTLTFAMFIKILYSNVDNVAGYSENEMLFFLWMSQLVFYVQFFTFENNVGRLSGDVNNGSLDLILTKPIPSLFYISLRRISLVGWLRDAIPSVFFLSLMINFSDLGATYQSIFVGIIIFLLGIICLYVMSILTVLPVFWLGKNDEIHILGQRVQGFGRRELPFEGFGKVLQVSLTAFVPVLIATGLATSVILNKRSLGSTLIYVTIITIMFLWLKSVFWKKALRAYSSASS